jgi:hypothetical protein
LKSHDESSGAHDSWVSVDRIILSREAHPPIDLVVFVRASFSYSNIRSEFPFSTASRISENSYNHIH